MKFVKKLFDISEKFPVVYLLLLLMLLPCLLIGIPADWLLRRGPLRPLYWFWMQSNMKLGDRVWLDTDHLDDVRQGLVVDTSTLPKGVVGVKTRLILPVPFNLMSWQPNVEFRSIYDVKSWMVGFNFPQDLEDDEPAIDT